MDRDQRRLVFGLLRRRDRVSWNLNGKLLEGLISVCCFAALSRQQLAFGKMITLWEHEKANSLYARLTHRTHVDVEADYLKDKIFLIARHLFQSLISDFSVIHFTHFNYLTHKI